jgi:2-desacetyl-2-hydroxyethyl bacteriochlorophyllide A dehydrogenase
MTTRAVVFPAANQFEMRELTLDAPGPTDIVVRTLVSALSPGTERWVLRGKHLGTRFPCVPGYHRIGVIEECGRDVTAFKVGDVVYGSAGRWKEEVVSMWGAHVDRSVGAASAYRFVAGASAPSQVELEALTFAIVAGVSHRGVSFCDVQEGQKLLIIGAGFVGICAAQFAAIRGATPVLLDANPERVSFLKEALPAISCLRVDAEDTPSTLEALAPGGFDILHDTVGHAATTDALVQRVRPQGTLLLQAQYFDKVEQALDLDQIKIRELTIKTTCGIRDDDWRETTAAIRAGRLQIAPLITHRFAAKDALDGFTLLHTGKPHSLGIVLDWSR